MLVTGDNNVDENTGDPTNVQSFDFINDDALVSFILYDVFEFGL